MPHPDNVFENCFILCRGDIRTELHATIPDIVTGDGFNDGPALAKADVGVAMGKGGTDMARESAGLVLIDDDFSSIVHAVSEGRRMLDNLRKALRFYLSCKLTLVLLFAISLSIGLPLPMLPLHVILLEMFMDLGASAAFTTERAEEHIMDRPAELYGRSKLLAGWQFWPLIAFSGCGLLLVVGSVYIIGLSLQCDDTIDVTNTVQTQVLTAWLFSHVLLAQLIRSLAESVLFSTFTWPFRRTRVLTLLDNYLLLMWTISAMLFAVVAFCLPVLSHVLHLSSLLVSVRYEWIPWFPTTQAWVLPIALPFCGFVLAEILKSVALVCSTRASAAHI